MTEATTRKKPWLKTKLLKWIGEAPAELPTGQSHGERDRIGFGNATEKSLDVKRGQNNIAYNPELVGNLNDDHKELVRFFTLTTKYLLKEKYLEAKQSLHDFYELLRGHVLEENVMFYCCLDGMLADVDPDNLEMSREMKAEMIGIQLDIKKFVAPYLTMGFKPESAKDFLIVWNGEQGDTPEAVESQRNSIKSKLVTRINREEGRLYRLYETLGKKKPAQKESKNG